jgi:putative hydrolase of the HAD superfamily
MPYHLTWAHESQHAVDGAHPRLLQVDSPSAIPAAVRELRSRAAGAARPRELESKP